MTALSETAFTAYGGDIKFGKNENGEGWYMVLIGPEGDYRANREKD